MTIHVVRAGESLRSIAAQYGVPPELLAGLNGTTAETPLAVGQTLVVRLPAEVHTVSAGETVYGIARRYGLSVRQLYQNNFSLGGRSELAIGQTLVLAYADTPLRTIGVNGYAYPHISGTLLDAALPYLTYLTPFTYGFTETGALVPLDDGRLLAAAGRQRAAALLHLSTLTEEGRFSNERSSALLANEPLQETLAQSILQAMREKGFYGLDVDFEYVPPHEREAYAAFITRLRETLNPLGYPVIVALAPKTSAAQRGLLYEAHDYALLGEAANAVFLMTYEWGYTYGPPMAVAPLPQVRAVLDYAVTEIAPARILLGVPLYGYDWPLPFVQGETRAQSVSPVQAVEQAVRAGAEIFYDGTAQAPYYAYADPAGREHIVWFEDARSIEAKLRLVDEYGLQGVGYWSLMRPFPQNWAVLSALYDIETLL